MARVAGYYRCAEPGCMHQVARDGVRCPAHGGVLPMRFADRPRCEALTSYGGPCPYRALEGGLCSHHRKQRVVRVAIGRQEA